MPTSEKIESFSKSDEHFKKVLAGSVTVEDFFTQKKYAKSKNAFMAIYKEEFGARPKESLYTDENVAAAWIAKLRYNQEMTDTQFQEFINRSENIFNGNGGVLNLKKAEPTGNDMCAIMWGIEALNGIQSFDSGATRVRFPPA